MLHGIIYAKHAWDLNLPDQSLHFVSEARSAAGSGTMLQELYITPSLLGEPEWDALAEAARWARKHARTMIDTHWVGGDPNELQIYGWASWRGWVSNGLARGEAILTLRNPSPNAASINLDAAAVFELPSHAPQIYSMASPYEEQRVRKLLLVAGRVITLPIGPFEVLSFEADTIERDSSSRKPSL